MSFSRFAPGLCIVLSIANGVHGQGLTFTTNTVTVGPSPVCVVAADVNGDGRPDLISANVNGGSLTILTNDGNGGFAFSATLSENWPGGSVTVAAADVNGDGKLDLVCANEELSTAIVFTNNGHGVFAFNASLTVGTSPFCIIAADVTGDGKPDLITANGVNADGNNNTLTILTNNGQGAFISNAAPVVGVDPSCVIAADVNGDGSLDLISANSGPLGSPGNTLTVLTNNGHGTFKLNATLTVGRAPVCVVAADVNGDGSLAMISANAAGNTLTVLTNDGHGVFGSNATLKVGSGPVVRCCSGHQW